MNDEFKRLWALLICQIWAKYHLKKTRQISWARPTEEEFEPGYLFGHYLMVGKDAFRTWVGVQRWGEDEELTEYQCSFFEYIEEMVDDIYPGADKNDLGMAIIYGDDTREDVAMILNLMPKTFVKE